VPEVEQANLLPRLRTQQEYFDYLDRWTVGTVDDLRARKTTRALVKAFLLETSRSNGSRDAISALSSVDQEIHQVDDALYRVRWSGDEGDWAIIDVQDQRYPILYSAVDSATANRRVDQIIIRSPFLDRGWFPAPMFRTLWQLVLRAYPEHRFSQLVFEYESVYEASTENYLPSPSQSHKEEGTDGEDENIVPWSERRRARIQITERLGKLKTALPQMEPAYDPLQSIVRLRMPAPHRGGHDIYFDGRFTNRSDSVVALRQTVHLVTDLYRRSTELAEQASWPQSTENVGARQPISLGSPLLVKFSRQLDLATFDRWIASLRRKNNRFRLWGNPILLGPGKVHLYAVDNHLWQPIDLEITQDHLYALLPFGTCGNSIHRLVTNIQRFVDPKPDAYIGSRPYKEFLSDQ